jgi:hypothetical protein
VDFGDVWADNPLRMLPRVHWSSHLAHGARMWNSGGSLHGPRSKSVTVWARKRCISKNVRNIIYKL